MAKTKSFNSSNCEVEDKEEVKSFRGCEEPAKYVDAYSKADADLLFSRSFTFIKETPASEWVIPHNMGKYGSVAVYNDLNEMVYPDIEIIDSNSIKIIFGRPNSGIAIVHV